MKKLLIFFLPAILLGCDSPAYRNPLDVAFGDPFILQKSTKYLEMARRGNLYTRWKFIFTMEKRV